MVLEPRLKPIFSSLLYFGVVLGLLIAFPRFSFAATLTNQAKQAEETAGGISGLFQTILEKSPSWVVAIVVFGASFAFANVIKNKVVDKFAEKFAHEDQDILVLVGRSTYAVVLALGITIALKIAGIDVTAIVAAVGFGLGFAMQDLMTNFIAGILILLNRPFTIGDFIKVGETVGKVMEIQSRATILKAIDGTRVIVPNADLFTNQVTSFTSNPFRRVEIIMSAAYGSDVKYVQKIIKGTLKDHAGILLEPKPGVLLSEFGDSSIDFAVRFWVDSRSNWLKVKSEVMALLMKNFEHAGIEMPYNTLNVVMDRQNEKVALPFYALSPKEMADKKSQREAQEAVLAEQIAASVGEKDHHGDEAADAQDTMDSLLPGSPPIPAAVPHPSGAQVTTEVAAPPAPPMTATPNVGFAPASAPTNAVPVTTPAPSATSQNVSADLNLKTSSTPGMPGATYSPPLETVLPQVLPQNGAPSV